MSRAMLSPVERAMRSAIMVGGAATFAPESEAIFAAFTTPPSNARKTAIDTLVRALKAITISGGSTAWDEFDILYMLAAADSQAARINWKAPGAFTATAVNAPTFLADRHFVGNGTSSYLSTNWTPSINAVKFALNSAAVWFWSRNDVQEAAGVAGGNLKAGSTAATSSVFCRPRDSSDKSVMRMNDVSSYASAISAIPIASEMMVFVRSEASARAVYRNGSLLSSTATGASTSLSDAVQRILADSLFSTRQGMFAGWSSSAVVTDLTAHAAIVAAVRAYGQALGAA